MGPDLISMPHTTCEDHSSAMGEEHWQPIFYPQIETPDQSHNIPFTFNGFGLLPATVPNHALH